MDLKSEKKLYEKVELIKGENINSSLKIIEKYNTSEKTNLFSFHKSKINILFFFLSEYGFILILLFILCIIYLLPQNHSAKTFTSKSSNIFNSDYIPKIFIHISDIHITLNNRQKLDGSSIFLSSIYEYKPDFFITTGDLVDNFVGKNYKMGGQNNEDWKVYNISIRKNLAKFPVIDVSGNHDLWAVERPTSLNNNFLKYSFMFNRANVKNEDDFLIKKVNKFGLTFILLNDYRFPVIRPPYGAETLMTKKQLDKLEYMIDNLEEDECYILSHYPIDRAILTKSSKGKNIEKIISNKKVGFIFTGHNHPNSFDIVHHGSEGGLEFCTPSAFDKKKAGLITIDNGNLIYHEVHIPFFGEKPLFFLTYPVPNEQISSHHIFNLNTFDIRIIAYIPNKNIKLKIEGDIKGEMHYVKTLNNGALLYSFSVNLPDGSYKIHIYDESGYSCNINSSFTVGEKFKGKKEKYLYNTRFLFSYRFMIIPFWICLLIIIFPFGPDMNFKIVKIIENIIGKETKNVFNYVSLVFYTLVFSPFILRLRFRTIVNKILRYIFFIAFIYPLVLPIHFSEKFEGVRGYSFFVFFVTKSRVFYEHWSLQMTSIYYLGIIYPYVLFLSGKKYYPKKPKIILFINSIFCVISFIIIIYINFRAVNQSISYGYLFFTPGFIIMLVLLFIFSYIFY